MDLSLFCTQRKDLSVEKAPGAEATTTRRGFIGGVLSVGVEFGTRKQEALKPGLLGHAEPLGPEGLLNLQGRLFL